ncbi:FAD-binding oxidoreductase [Thermoproteota archaeon]
MNPENLRSELAVVVGENYISDSLYERRLYDHDVAPLPTEVGLIFKTIPDIVVKPGTTDEVAQIVKYAHDNMIPIVPRGSSSWGYGGTIPTNGGIVLGLVRLKEITGLDLGGMVVHVGAGVRWLDLLTYLEGKGYTFPVYPSSAPSATIGGWLATGGLGIGSLKYGHVMEHVKAITVVSPTGEILVLNKETDQGEFEMFFDSEGTLGIITEVTLKIQPKPELIKPLLSSFENYDTLVKVVQKLIKKPVRPYFIEIQDGEYLDIKRSIGISVPDVPVLGLFVYEGQASEVQEYSEILRRAVSEAGGTMHSDEEAKEEWLERFYYMRIKKAGPTLLAGEITFPIPRLQFVLNETMKIKKKHNLKLGVKAFVVSDDSILFMPMFLADERKRWKYLAILPVINEITEVGLKAGGGPYGIGIWNAFFLKATYGAEKFKELKARKKRLDPKDIMNPGKLYQVKTRFGIPLWGTLFKLLTSMLWILKYF